MENASKALIMAGEILIGIIILSLGAYFIMNIRHVPETYDTIMDEQEVIRFNTYFTKFVGREDITAQEIVSVAYYAQEFNNEIGSRAITIVVIGEPQHFTEDPNSLEKTTWNNFLTDFIENNTYVESDTEIIPNSRPTPKKYRCRIADNARTREGIINRVEFIVEL